MRVTSQIIFSVCFFCVVTFTYEVRPQGISIVPSFGINTENDTLAPINSSQFVVKREILGVSTFGLDLEAPVGKPLKIGISYMYMKALLRQSIEYTLIPLGYTGNIFFAVTANSSLLFMYQPALKLVTRKGQT